MSSESFQGLYGHSATAVGNTVTVIGGKTSPLSLNRTVSVLDLGTRCWSTLDCAGVDVPARAFHTADLFKWKLYVFGGVLGVSIDDVHHNNYNVFVHPDALDRVTGTKRGHDRLKDPLHIRKLTQARQEASSLYVLDLEEGAVWSAPATYGSCPPTRANHSSAIYRDSLYIAGGYSVHTSGLTHDEEARAVDSVYLLNLFTNVWTSCEVAASPAAQRFGFSVVQVGNFWLQFGGTDVVKHAETSTTNVLDMETLTWRTVPTVPCPARAMHTAVTYGDGMYVFGGACNVTSQLFNDVYRMDILTGIWNLVATRGAETPPPMCGHAAVVVGCSMMVIGGMTSSLEYSDHVWMLNLETMEWSRAPCSVTIRSIQNVRGIQYGAVAQLARRAQMSGADGVGVSVSVQTQSFGEIEYDNAYSRSYHMRTNDIAAAVQASRARLEWSLAMGRRTPTSNSSISGGRPRDVGESFSEESHHPIHREVAARVQRMSDMIQVSGNMEASSQVAQHWGKEIDKLVHENHTWQGNGGIVGGSAFASAAELFTSSILSSADYRTIPQTLAMAPPPPDGFINSPLITKTRGGYVSPSIAKLGLQDYLASRKAGK